QPAPRQTVAPWQPALRPESVRLSLPTGMAQYPAAGVGIVYDPDWFVTPCWLLSLSARRASPHHPGLAASPSRAPRLPGDARGCQCAVAAPPAPPYHRTNAVRWLRPGHR